ncbi:MAG: outer membrane lipoprotein-sorting protein [Saprospiraceae bacterium]|nr:outer membrane lipoprotein-sorting protein [Saprospiraceae bacterium]
MSKNIVIKAFLSIALWLIVCSVGYSQESALEIIQKADDHARGVESSKGIMRMTIIRPTWQREIEMKTWAKGTEYSLTLVTAPARDRGTATLKREKEIWNWQPSIDRAIKLPASMMMQSWMGSDFTNDDLVRESSIVVDYTHALIGEEVVEERVCHLIELIPKPDAPVVWGKVLVRIDKADYLQLKTEFFDEDGYLVNTMLGTEIKELGGRLLPTRLEMIPAEEEGRKTVVEQLDIDFNAALKESFFSIQNMKRVR